MEWTKGWRDQVWLQLDQEWDVLIIGGGITGAGILRECALAGLQVLLVEADDFASGTSSRSSKLAHGGLRYLKNAQIRVTLESVHEREYLLRQGRGLINRLGFLYACLPDDHTPGWVFGAGLTVYDIMARQWSHRSYDADDIRELCPASDHPGVARRLSLLRRQHGRRPTCVAPAARVRGRRRAGAQCMPASTR